MQIKEKVLIQINESTKMKNLLALAMGKSVYTISRWISDRDDNLTKASALKVIQEETGLTQDEILEEDSVTNNSLTKVISDNH